MNRLEIIERLKHLPGELEVSVAGLPEATLRFRPAEGEWSINETVGHVRDLAEVWHKRLYMVASLTDPQFTSFDGEASVIEHNYQDADLATLFREMREWRSKTVVLLAHTVDWTRIGQQRGVGRRSLRQFAEFLISHDEEHIAEVQRLKELVKQPAASA